MWDTVLTLMLVALATVYVVRKLLMKPHCGPSDSCEDCSSHRKGSDLIP